MSRKWKTKRRSRKEFGNMVERDLGAVMGEAYDVMRNGIKRLERQYDFTLPQSDKTLMLKSTQNLTRTLYRHISELAGRK
jgi:hypothetical protein